MPPRPEPLYFSERQLWRTCPEARDVLARLARTRVELEEARQQPRGAVDPSVRWYASEGDGVPWVVLQDEGGMVNVIAECDQQVYAENIARALNARGAVAQRAQLEERHVD